MWVWTSYKAWTISLGQSVGMQLCTVCWIRVWRIAWRVSSWVRLASTYTWWVLSMKEQNYIKYVFFYLFTELISKSSKACFVPVHPKVCIWVLHICWSIIQVWCKHPSVFILLHIFLQLFDKDNYVNKHFSKYVFSTEGHLFPVNIQFRSKVWEEKTMVPNTGLVQRSGNLSVCILLNWIFIT
jgi:hypothetical protein